MRTAVFVLGQSSPLENVQRSVCFIDSRLTGSRIFDYLPLCPGASLGNLLEVRVWAAEYFVAAATLIRVSVIEIATTPRRTNAGNVDFSLGTLPAAISAGAFLTGVLPAPHAILRGSTGWTTHRLSTMLHSVSMTRLGCIVGMDGHLHN